MPQRPTIETISADSYYVSSTIWDRYCCARLVLRIAKKDCGQRGSVWAVPRYYFFGRLFRGPHHCLVIAHQDEGHVPSKVPILASPGPQGRVTRRKL